MLKKTRTVIVMGVGALLVVAVAGGTAGLGGTSLPPPDLRDVAVADPATQFVPGEILVRFRGGLSASARAAALETHGARRVRDLRIPGLVLARLARGKTVPAAVEALSRRVDVLYAEPNWIYRAAATPNDPRFGELWGLHQTSDADIDAPEAWDTTTGSSDVVVAVVDTGLAYDHPDLAPNLWANTDEVAADGLDNDGNGFVDDVRGWDFVDGDNDPRDTNGHGTHVAGTIGAKGDNATGVVGVNWNVRLMPVRVLGPFGGTNAQVADGFAYAAANGARIVNASIGGPGASQAIEDAIQGAPGTLFVVAAGNGGLDGFGDDNEVIPQYPCNFTAANVVCVAATTRTDQLAEFSNYGSVSVDLGAPGTVIASTWLGYDSLLSEGFESASGWVAGGTPNTWARTAESAATGSWSATDSPGGNYAPFTKNWFRAPEALDLSGRTGCHVRYALQLDTRNGRDYFVLEVSTDGSDWFYAGSTWSGSTSDEWTVFEEDLSLWDGEPTLFFRLGLESYEAGGAFDGAHVDDLDVRCFSTNYPADAYASIDGTSMATPHVAGVAALAWAKHPAASVAQVRSALLDGGDAVPALNGKTVSGRRLNANGTLALVPGSGSFGLAVAKSGTGFGTVTGPGIDCGADCAQSFASGTLVTLTATAGAGSALGGWSGCDSSSGASCTVAMGAARTVTASFTATPTFADVPPSNPFYEQIERLYDLGITTGCGTNGSGALIFCPGDPVPRQQMAAFLIRAKGLTQLFPATPSFVDVPASNPFYGYIERLKEQGITTGCNPPTNDRFCPAEFVPRQQMAAFLVRAKGLTQLASPTPAFADVPTSNPFYGWIERLYAEGITTGCGTNGAGQRLYCPGDHVPRQQMAAFLVRAFAT